MFSPALVLPAGTYWLDWGSADSGATGHFDPAVTVVGSRTQVGWNAQQLTVSTSTWAGAIDAGNPATAPDVAQDFPFNVTGSSAGVCGDGVVFGEVCDDGNTVNGDGCNSNCTLTACGNGIVSTGEVCDDGNLTDGDGCDSNCSSTACGNGVVTAGEVCDDGNTVNGDGCDVNCTVSACGNGIVSPGEACDDGNVTEGDGCDSNCTLTA